MSARLRVLAAVALCSASLAEAAPPDQALAGILEALESNRLELALQRTETLIDTHPNFRLAHLIRGDLLLARARPLETFGNVAKTVPRDKVEDLRAEALARLRSLRERPQGGRSPRQLLQLAPDQRHAIVVDVDQSRLFLFENSGGRPRLVADYYVTLGKRGVEKTREGDQKTPIGVYHVTGNLPRGKLTDFYGVGAYPINYPNEWDKRLGRNGHGIWLHGVPRDTYSRPPRASDGCLVLANQDLESIARHLEIGRTPVIISDEIEWRDASEIDGERRAIGTAFEAWRTDWESRDTSRYLRHYSAQFRSEDQDLAAWAAHKRKVNEAKSWIKVGVSRVSMFRYPREDFVVVSFDQDYRSSNLSNSMRKRQYWRRDGAAWKILYEGGQ